VSSDLWMDKKKALKKLGEKIKKQRKLSGLTQSQLAAKVDKDQQSIQRLEKGRVNPSYFYLLEICKGLGIKIEELL